MARKINNAIHDLNTIKTHFGRLFVDDDDAAEQIARESVVELKMKLFTDIIAIFESLNVEKSTMNKFTSDMIDVQENCGSVIAIIKCVFCELENHIKTKNAKTEHKISRTKRNGVGCRLSSKR